MCINPAAQPAKCRAGQPKPTQEPARVPTGISPSQVATVAYRWLAVPCLRLPLNRCLGIFVPMCLSDSPARPYTRNMSHKGMKKLRARIFSLSPFHFSTKKGQSVLCTSLHIIIPIQTTETTPPLVYVHKQTTPVIYAHSHIDTLYTTCMASYSLPCTRTPVTMWHISYLYIYQPHKRRSTADDA